MQLLTDLLATLPDAAVVDVRIGLHWTAVVVENGDTPRCGLASTLAANHAQHGTPDVPQTGTLHTLSAHELASFAQNIDQPTLASVGIAAINALLPREPEKWVELNAEEKIAEHGAGKTVALIGSFPFIPRLRERVGSLNVLDQHPQPGEHPASAAAEILPQADVIAITGMTLQNHTLANLLPLCRPDAFLMMLGPSTPLSPVPFQHGFSVLSGAVVTDIDAVLRGVSQGAVFRQLHKLGVQLVNVERSDA